MPDEGTAELGFGVGVLPLDVAARCAVHTGHLRACRAAARFWVGIGL